MNPRVQTSSRDAIEGRGKVPREGPQTRIIRTKLLRGGEKLRVSFESGRARARSNMYSRLAKHTSSLLRERRAHSCMC